MAVPPKRAARHSSLRRLRRTRGSRRQGYRTVASRTAASRREPSPRTPGGTRPPSGFRCQSRSVNRNQRIPMRTGLTRRPPPMTTRPTRRRRPPAPARQRWWASPPAPPRLHPVRRRRVRRRRVRRRPACRRPACRRPACRRPACRRPACHVPAVGSPRAARTDLRWGRTMSQADRTARPRHRRSAATGTPARAPRCAVQVQARPLRRVQAARVRASPQVHALRQVQGPRQARTTAQLQVRHTVSAPDQGPSRA
jgi:hypothetical protein